MTRANNGIMGNGEQRKPSDRAGVKSPSAAVQGLIDNIAGAFLGKEEVTAHTVLALIAGGHVLLEDVPGLGKTLLANAVAKSLHARFKRIQFTADLLPSDVTGVTVYAPDRQEFVFRPGPIFTDVLLADEINRATPRTQSSLLEGMEEGQVTVDGEAHALDEAFFVIATQNPVELEGTYPLPFAQMDRFMVRLSIGYLDRDCEVEMLRRQQQAEPLDQIGAVMDLSALSRLRAAARAVTVEDTLRTYLVDLVRLTRSSELLAHGASPRGALDLQSFSQALALWRGRDYVLPDDIKRAAALVLPHRLIVRQGVRARTLNIRGVVEQLVESIPVPV